MDLSDRRDQSRSARSPVNWISESPSFLGLRNTFHGPLNLWISRNVGQPSSSVFRNPQVCHRPHVPEYPQVEWPKTRLKSICFCNQKPVKKNLLSQIADPGTGAVVSYGPGPGPARWAGLPTSRRAVGTDGDVSARWRWHRGPGRVCLHLDSTQQSESAAAASAG